MTAAPSGAERGPALSMAPDLRTAVLRSMVSAALGALAAQRDLPVPLVADALGLTDDEAGELAHLAAVLAATEPP